MLPFVVRYNSSLVERDYADLVSGSTGVNGDASADALVERLRELFAASGLPSTLSGWNVDRGALPDLAREAATQWTARFNPRDVAVEDFLQLYESAF